MNPEDSVDEVESTAKAKSSKLATWGAGFFLLLFFYFIVYPVGLEMVEDDLEDILPDQLIEFLIFTFEPINFLADRWPEYASLLNRLIDLFSSA